MNYEVVVVGGGIGGLTAAALLAARGVNVCLFERQSRPGGCVANFEHLGYQFEPTAGLYSGWEAGGIYERIFSELPIKPPQVHRLAPAYVVRLPDRSEVAVSENLEQFEENLRLIFPECAEAAVAFYRNLWKVIESETKNDVAGEAVAAHLDRCSFRFRRFIDVQLQTFIQCPSDKCRYDQAAVVLNPQLSRWAIEGGAQSLCDALAESLIKSGGKLRLNAPVLRLAYGSDGSPVGVDLLSGERVVAARAIISNLTLWDTYGKLIGLSRTPSSISSQLRKVRAWGAYLLFLSLDESAASRLTSNRIVALTEWQENQSFDPERAQFVFAAASPSDPRAPESKLAVTVSAFTNAEDWFGFHEDQIAHEQQDQSMLESLWSRLHSAMPELRDSVEVIESATPQTFYETTRRKFGMVGRVCASATSSNLSQEFGTTLFPNVFLVGDTVAPGIGIAGVSQSAYAVADALARRVRKT